MIDYLLLWRALPKLLMGLVLIVYLYLLGYGNNTTTAERWWSSLVAHFSGWPLLFATVIILLLLSVLGLMMLGVIEIGMSAISDVVWSAVRRPSRWLPDDLLAPPEDIALQTLKKNIEFFTRFFHLRNRSVLNLEKENELQQYMDDVKEFLSLVKSGELVHDLNYYTNIAQERRALEIAQDEIRTLWHLVGLLVLTLVLLFLGGGLIIGFFGAAVVPFLILGILRSIARRKRQIALMLIGGFLDNFTMGEWAHIADRPGEPLI